MTILARANQLELRLSRDPVAIEAAQRLRYRVFYEEMGALPAPAMLASRIDSDRFDETADHLLLVDLERGTERQPKVVGCYRILRESVARSAGGFYTAHEFDLGGVRCADGEIMEFGRSCVEPEYRTGAVMQLLWRGIADYIDSHGVGLMLGCASLPGTDPEAAAMVLSFLHHNVLAPEGLRPRALPDRLIPTDRMPAEAVDMRAALKQLPPLLKAYLRMGGMIGEGAVIDRQFNTIDVCLVLPTERVQAKAGKDCPSLTNPARRAFWWSMTDRSATMTNTSVIVSLPETLKGYVQKRVADGAFSNPSDYVRALIREDRKRQAELISLQDIGLTKKQAHDYRAVGPRALKNWGRS